MTPLNVFRPFETEVWYFRLRSIGRTGFAGNMVRVEILQWISSMNIFKSMSSTCCVTRFQSVSPTAASQKYRWLKQAINASNKSSSVFALNGRMCNKIKSACGHEHNEGKVDKPRTTHGSYGMVTCTRVELQCRQLVHSGRAGLENKFVISVGREGGRDEWWYCWKVRVGIEKLVFLHVTFVA